MIIEKWKHSGAHVIGVDHINRQSVCQDRTYYTAQNGIYVLALADGAGSKAKSELGAECVTKTICDVIVKEFNEFIILCERRGYSEGDYLNNIHQLKTKILDTLIKELKKVSIDQKVSLEDLSSTLLFFAMKGNNYIVGHIGDGVIGGLFEEEQTLKLRTLSEPHNGGAPNITFFVTDKDALYNLRISAGEMEHLRGIVLMSDGPSDVLYDKKEGFNDNVYRIFENLNTINEVEYNHILSKFLSEKIAQYSYDDLSINILYLQRVNTNVDRVDEVELFKGITSKQQIIRKSQYSIYLDPSIKTNQIDFLNMSDIRGYLNWT